MKHGRNVKKRLDNIQIFRSLDNIHIERPHHVKRGKKDKSIKLRTVVCNLLSFKEKKLVMKNAKN